jgi:sugar O-acyltransferase (sialic acid O-acetyltransferase NeuD family)
MKDVVIIGAGGFAREAYWVFVEDNLDGKKWNVLGFVDDNAAAHGTMLCDIPILGGFDWLATNARPGLQVLCAVGATRTRKLLAEKTRALGLSFCTVIHPSVRMSRWVEVGEGSIITAGNILTTQVRIGAHALLNLDCTVGHDCVFGAYCTVNPGCHISGNVTFGDGVEFGTGAVIIQGKSVGEWSVVGAGAVVTSDVPPHVTAVGIPAKVIKQHLVPGKYADSVTSS